MVGSRRRLGHYGEEINLLHLLGYQLHIMPYLVILSSHLRRSHHLHHHHHHHNHHHAETNDSVGQRESQREWWTTTSVTCRTDMLPGAIFSSPQDTEPAV